MISRLLNLAGGLEASDACSSHPQCQDCLLHQLSIFVGLRPRDTSSVAGLASRVGESHNLGTNPRFYAFTHTPLIAVSGPKSSRITIRSECHYGEGRQRRQDVFPNTFLTQSHEAAKASKRVYPPITQISQIGSHAEAQGRWVLNGIRSSFGERKALCVVHGRPTF